MGFRFAKPSQLITLLKLLDCEHERQSVLQPAQQCQQLEQSLRQQPGAGHPDADSTDAHHAADTPPHAAQCQCSTTGSTTSTTPSLGWVNFWTRPTSFS
jgi:hypothetical protein